MENPVNYSSLAFGASSVGVSSPVAGTSPSVTSPSAPSSPSTTSAGFSSITSSFCNCVIVTIGDDFSSSFIKDIPLGRAISSTEIPWPGNSKLEISNLMESTKSLTLHLTSKAGNT